MRQRLAHIGDYVIDLDDIVCVKPDYCQGPGTWWQCVNDNAPYIVCGATIVLRGTANVDTPLSVADVWTCIQGAPPKEILGDD